jgi:hypothetical protein
VVLAFTNPHASHWLLISSAAVMADETNASIQSESPQGQQDGGFRGGRGGREGGGREGGGREGSGREGGREGGGRDGGNREPGGFRIRLSENEMRAARAIQEAFGLRSTVAALGLSLRTVAQLLEDGQLGEFKSGFALIAKRAAAPIVPVAIVGGFECWPRTRLLPRPGRIRLEFGEIVTAEQVAAMSEHEIFAVCTQRIHDLDAKARAALGATARSRPAVSSPRGPA